MSRRSALSIALFSLMILSATLPAAAESAPEAQPAQTQVVSPPADANERIGDPQISSPTLVEEMEAAKLAAREALAPLRVAFENDTDPQRAIAIQREIQALKWNTQLGYLEIQARHAREVGMDHLAEQSIEMLENMRARQREEARIVGSDSATEGSDK